MNSLSDEIYDVQYDRTLTRLKSFDLIIGRPSAFDDWRAIMAASGQTAMPPQYLAAARYQTAMPTSFTVWKTGRRTLLQTPLFMGGAVPLVNHSVIWFQSGSDMKDHLIPIIKWARGEMLRQKKLAVNNSLIMEVQRGHKPGQRLAALVGFKRKSVNQTEIWEL